MTHLLTRFSLKAQIASLVGLAGIIILVCLGVLWSARAQTAEAEAVQTRESRMALAAARLEVALLGARRREKDFLIRRDPAQIAKQNKHVTDAQIALADIASALPAGDDRMAKVEELRRNIGAYAEAFRKVSDDTVRVGLTEKDGLMRHPAAFILAHQP